MADVTSFGTCESDAEGVVDAAIPAERLLVFAAANLFFAMSLSSGESFLVVVEVGAVVAEERPSSVSSFSSPSSSSAGASAGAVDDGALVVVVVRAVVARAGRPIGDASFGRLMGVFTGGDGLLLVAETMGRFSVGLSKSDSDGDAVEEVDALRTVVQDLFVVVGTSVVVVVEVVVVVVEVVVDADVVLVVAAVSALAMATGISST